jgi:hypothetical protein
MTFQVRTNLPINRKAFTSSHVIVTIARSQCEAEVQPREGTTLPLTSSRDALRVRTNSEHLPSGNIETRLQSAIINCLTGRNTPATSERHDTRFPASLITDFERRTQALRTASTGRVVTVSVSPTASTPSLN